MPINFPGLSFLNFSLTNYLQLNIFKRTFSSPLSKERNELKLKLFLQAEPNSEKINKRSSLPTVIFYRVNKSNCMKNSWNFQTMQQMKDERATSSQKNKLKSRSMSNVIRKVFACAGIKKSLKFVNIGEVEGYDRRKLSVWSPL